MSGIATAIVGSAVIGGVVQSKSSKRAAETASAGSEREVEFNRESRDLVREDQKPYREAGYKALDALQSLTGLGGGSPQSSISPSMQGFGSRLGGALGRTMDGAYDFEPSRTRRWARTSAFGSRAMGGSTVEGEYYNINELGPESVYSGGEYTRTPNPRTISDTDGYVQPNIKGRALGGFTQDRNIMYGPQVGWGGPQQQLPMGVGGPYGGLPNRPPATPVQPPPSDYVYNTNWQDYGGRSPAPGGGYGGDWQNQAGTTAINPQTGYPNENPGGEPGGYQFETDPGYQFRFSEGQRALDRGAAARGGLLSGGYARKAIRYGQGFASNEFTNVYNRIANIAGLGQTANQASGNAALQAGAYMGNAASNAANASAYGQIQAGNAWANAGNQIAQMPWGNVFKPGNQDPDPTRYGTSVYGG